MSPGLMSGRPRQVAVTVARGLAAGLPAASGTGTSASAPRVTASRPPDSSSTRSTAEPRRAGVGRRPQPDMQYAVADDRRGQALPAERRGGLGPHRPHRVERRSRTDIGEVLLVRRRGELSSARASRRATPASRAMPWAAASSDVVAESAADDCLTEPGDDELPSADDRVVAGAPPPAAAACRPGSPRPGCRPAGLGGCRRAGRSARPPGSGPRVRRSRSPSTTGGSRRAGDFPAGRRMRW